MKQFIKTPRGTFNAIELKDVEEADKLGFCYYFTNTDKKDIYIKHLDIYHCEFGFIESTIPKNCFMQSKGEIIIKNIFKYILGYCNCCGKYFKYPKLYRENTMYNDEEMNWHRECKSCFNKHENYWDECWKEYYSGRY